jgi:putative NIF3 family GTP cyclohydrolase 1 type 2
MMLRKSLLLVAALAVSVVAIAAHTPADSAVGTWQLDVAHSTFGSQNPPLSQTRIYRPAPHGMHVTILEQDANGQKTHTTLTITYDGKPHPVKGNPDYDHASATRVDQNEINGNFLRAGQVVGNLKRVVSPDGKTLTINTRYTKADGTTETGLSVYRRQ